MYKTLIVPLPVSIISIASLSPLGNSAEGVWESYINNSSLIKNITVGNKVVPAAILPLELQKEVSDLAKSDTKYTHLDSSVLYAIVASRAAVKNAGWQAGDNFGINIGSSRGATQLFEEHYREYLETGKSRVQASPSTTLGNISSWVAQDLKTSGPDVSHSVTRSTALHAVLNGVAWLRAGMADKFLVGGSEAPVTSFTIAQMQAMKIYSALNDEYPCRAFDLDKKTNTMVLGEGSAAACMELGRKSNALAFIEGIGYSTEMLQHSASISADAECLQRSMMMALQDCDTNEIDAIVMHTPGTLKGDLSEYNAIQKLFGDAIPLLTTNKWKIGHTLGASGLLSLEMAILMLMHQRFIGVPYLDENGFLDKPLRKILINAAGFGGNAVSVLLSKNENPELKSGVASN